MKKKSSRWIWLSIASILLLLIIIFIGKKNDKGQKVAIEKAKHQNIVESVIASGKIYPETELSISPEVSGEIVALNVKEGDSVSQGTLLVKINPAIYNSQVQQAEAAMEQNRSGVLNAKQVNAQSEASFKQAQLNYERNKKLYNDKVISASEFEQIEATYKSTKANYEATLANIRSSKYGVQASNANLSLAKANMLKTTIVAPRSGIISVLNVKKGERVLGTSQMQGTELLRIADMSRIEVRVDVSETDITKVKLGDTCIITADAYRDRTFKGIVSKVSVSSSKSPTATSTSDQVTNYTVYILILRNSYDDLVVKEIGQYPFKPGMSASVEIQTNRKDNVLAVPVNAVTTRDWPDSLKHKEGLRQVVFIYEQKSQKVKMVDVETGIQDNANIQILKGLKSNDEIITAPYGAIARLLKNEDKVQVVPKENLFDVK